MLCLWEFYFPRIMNLNDPCSLCRISLIALAFSLIFWHVVAETFLSLVLGLRFSINVGNVIPFLIPNWNHNEISCDIAYHRICHSDELHLVYYYYYLFLSVLFLQLIISKTPITIIFKFSQYIPDGMESQISFFHYDHSTVTWCRRHFVKSHFQSYHHKYTL